MHEISLVRNIFRTLEEEFPNDMQRIRGIYLKAGLLSNVQPILMQNAFQAVLEDQPKYNKTSLHVEVLSILIHCDLCGQTSEVEQYRVSMSKTIIGRLFSLHKVKAVMSITLRPRP